MKDGVNLIPVVLTAAGVLVASLVAIVFTSDIGTSLYLVSVAILGAFALSLGIAVRRGRQRSIISVEAFVAFLGLTAVQVIHQDEIRFHLHWLLWSRQYKSEVLANSTAADGELKHSEWHGDGWGGAATGDWASYVVFDPSDSLSAASERGVGVPAEYKGIPCKVISVRRLEKQWYSVVLDMNQFWDKMHPAC